MYVVYVLYVDIWCIFKILIICELCEFLGGSLDQNWGRSWRYSPLLEWKPLVNCVVKAFLVTIGSMILVKKELLSRRNSHSGWCFKASETCLSNWIFSSSLKWGLKPRYCWELDAQISKKRLLQVAKKITRNYGIQCVHWIHVGSTVSCMLDLIRFPWVPWSKHISLDVSSARPELQISLSIFFGEFYKKNRHAWSSCTILFRPLSLSVGYIRLPCTWSNHHTNNWILKEK